MIDTVKFSVGDLVLGHLLIQPTRAAAGGAVATKRHDPSARNAAWRPARDLDPRPLPSPEIEELLTSDLNSRCEIGMGGDL